MKLKRVMEDRVDFTKFLIRWLDSLVLSYKFTLSDLPLLSSVQKTEGGDLKILTAHNTYISVDGARLISGISPKRAGWYDSNNVFIYHTNNHDSMNTANFLQIIDVNKGSVIESLELYENYSYGVCSKAMQAFIMGSSDLHVIDIRTKRRLLLRLESPLYGLSLFSRLPYTVFYLTGRNSLSLCMMDLRMQREMNLCPTIIHPVEHCDLEVCFHEESDALMCSMQSKSSFIIFRDLKTTTNSNDRPDALSIMSQVSRVAKHPDEKFTWLHTMFCLDNQLVFPAIVSEASSSRLMVLDVSGSIELQRQKQKVPLYSLNSQRNKSLSLESALSRASSTAAAKGILTAVIDGAVYTTATS